MNTNRGKCVGIVDINKELVDYGFFGFDGIAVDTNKIIYPNRSKSSI